MDLTEPRSSPGSEGAGGSGVGPVEDRHNAQLAALFREAWDAESTEDEVARWRAREARDNPVEPGREPPKWVFTKGDEALGYLGTIPARFSVEGREFISHWLKGLWVRPQYRAGPVGFAIVQRAVTDLGTAASSVVGEPARRLLEAHGLRDHGTLFNKIRALRPGRLLRHLDLTGLGLHRVPRHLRAGLGLVRAARATWLAGTALSSATALGVAVRGRPARVDLTWGWSGVDEDDLDAAWSAFQTKVRAASVRDGAHISWRYTRRPEYDVCAAWQGGTLRAWSIVRKPATVADDRLKGLSVASLSDVLFPPDEPAVGLAVVAGAERLARDMDADALLCSGTHSTLADILARRGFLSIPANLHFLARDWGGDVFADPLSEWWLTRGDAESDESF